MGQFEVLIVEDDAEVLELEKQAIEDKRLDVYTCRDGAEARYLVQNRRFDIIILDLLLPSVSGLQIAKVARNFKPNALTPIIFVSGNLQRNSFDDIARVPLSTTMAKPFSHHKLKLLVNRHLQGMVGERMADLSETELKKRMESDPNIIKAFVAASQEVLRAYLREDPKIESISVIPPGKRRLGHFLSMTEFQSTNYKGNFWITLPGEFVKKFLYHVLGDEDYDPDSGKEVTGELCNQILGKALGKMVTIDKNFAYEIPTNFQKEGIPNLSYADMPCVNVEISVIGCTLEFDFVMAKYDENEVETSSYLIGS